MGWSNRVMCGAYLRRSKKGVAAGKSREIGVMREIPNAATGFQPMERRPSSDHAVLAGKRSESRRVLSDAETIVKEGGRASAFIFSTSARAHKVRFTKGEFGCSRAGFLGVVYALDRGIY